MNAVRLFAAVLLTLVIANESWSQTKADGKPRLPPQRPPQPMSYESLREKLDSTVVVEFVETPVKDVIAYLADFLEAPLRFDTRAMEEITLSLDAPVTISLRRVTAATALRIIFDQINDSDTPVEFVRRDGLIEITTRTRIDRVIEPRVYLVRDLPAVDAESPEATLTTVMNLIRTSVEPASWDTAGGTGTIAALPTVLVIRQSPRVHDRIDDLLHMIRDATAEAEKDEIQPATSKVR